MPTGCQGLNAGICQTSIGFKLARLSYCFYLMMAPVFSLHGGFLPQCAGTLFDLGQVGSSAVRSETRCLEAYHAMGGEIVSMCFHVHVF